MREFNLQNNQRSVKRYNIYLQIINSNNISLKDSKGNIFVVPLFVYSEIEYFSEAVDKGYLQKKPIDYDFFPLFSDEFFLMYSIN